MLVDWSGFYMPRRSLSLGKGRTLKRCRSRTDAPQVKHKTLTELYISPV